MNQTDGEPSTDDAYARPCSPGYTLLEFLAVIGVMGIVVALAYPTMTQWFACQRLQSASSTIATDLYFARGRAISETIKYQVVFIPDDDEYVMQKWNEVTASFEPAEMARRLAAPDNPYYAQGVDLVSPDSSIVFQPKGTSPGGITIELSSSACGKTRSITVNWVGRIKES